jgi:hypothetical protein
MAGSSAGDPLCITGRGDPVPVHEVLSLGHRLLQSATIATREGRGRVPDHDAAARASAK